MKKTYYVYYKIIEKDITKQLTGSTVPIESDIFLEIEKPLTKGFLNNLKDKIYELYNLNKSKYIIVFPNIYDTSENTVIEEEYTTPSNTEKITNTEKNSEIPKEVIDFINANVIETSNGVKVDSYEK